MYNLPSQKLTKYLSPKSISCKVFIRGDFDCISADYVSLCTSKRNSILRKYLKKRQNFLFQTYLFFTFSLKVNLLLNVSFFYC